MDASDKIDARGLEKHPFFSYYQKSISTLRIACRPLLLIWIHVDVRNFDNSPACSA